MASQNGLNLSNVFARIAPLYDLDYGDFTEDVEMFLNFAARTGGPILELGVGTGRLATELAEAGYQVVGIDQSSEMLDVCRSKLSSLLGAGRLDLVLGDIRDFSLEGHFPLIICAANSFGHLLTREEQIAALKCAKKSVSSGGLLVLDIDNPERKLAFGRDGELVLEWTKVNPRTHNLVCKFLSSKLEDTGQIQQITFIYDEVGPGGSVTRTVASFPLRYFYRSEVELLLNAAGYAVEAVYGDYYLDECGQNSDRMIFVATSR